MTRTRPKVLLAFAFLTSIAQAQTDTQLKEARAKFAEALRDEEARAYGRAIEKFRDVQSVRDTAAVRFRIATCLAAAGNLKEAQRAYQNVLADGAYPSTEDTAIREVSAKEADALDARIPQISVRPSDRKDAHLSIDGEAPHSVFEPARMNPGEHTVRLTRSGYISTESHVVVTERARIELELVLVPLSFSAQTVTPADATSKARAASSVPFWATVIGGSTLVALGVAALAVRESEIATIRSACPSGVCPLAERGALESKRATALLLGPIAWVSLGLGGAAGIAAIALYPSPGSNRATFTLSGSY
jgi:hypothetical protein